MNIIHSILNRRWRPEFRTPSFRVKAGVSVVFFADILFSLMSANPVFLPDHIAYYRDTGLRLRIAGEIISEPDVRSDGQNLVVEVFGIFLPPTGAASGSPGGRGAAGGNAGGVHAGDGTLVKAVHGKIMVKADRYPEYAYGEFLEIRCMLRAPPVFEKFSYAALLAKDDIFVLCTGPAIRRLDFQTPAGEAAGEMKTGSDVLPKTAMAGGSGMFRFFDEIRRGFWRTIFTLKSAVISRVNELFVEPQASLVAGILVGARRAIPQDILDDFNTAGLTHVLAISGYNVSMMISVFGYLCRGAARRRRYAAMFFGVMGLVAFTGFSASVLRAAWMGCIALLAQAVGRKGSGLHLLLVSGAVMVLFNPRMMLVDLSFQLSFLSTLGILVFMPRIEAFEQKLVQRSSWSWISKIPAFMREGFCVTLAAQVFTTPLLFYQFGRFSLIAPVANIFVLPLVPWIMLLGFLGTIVSFAVVPAGQILSFGAYALVSVMLVFVRFFATLPFASLQF